MSHSQSPCRSRVSDPIARKLTSNMSANLLRTEHMMQDQNINNRALSMFTLLLGTVHRVDPVNRRLMDDAGVEGTTTMTYSISNQL